MTFLEFLNSPFKVVLGTFMLLGPHSLNNSSDGNLSGNIVDKSRGLVRLVDLLNHMGGSDAKAKLPASTVEHLTERKDVDGLVPVCFGVIGEGDHLATTEGKMEIYLIGEDSDLRVLFEDLANTGNLIFCKDSTSRVVGVVQDEDL